MNNNFWETVIKVAWIFAGFLFVVSFLAMLYSVIAGIWGFVPIELINLKIFSTSIVAIIIASSIIKLLEEFE